MVAKTIGDRDIPVVGLAQIVLPLLGVGLKPGGGLSRPTRFRPFGGPPEYLPTDRPLEEVLLIRDENANLVWGVEHTIRMPTGDPHRGSEAAAEVLAYRRRQATAPTTDAEDPPRAALSYAAMNTIPEHWIPFIPVHVPNDNREIQLQRAAMPSAIDGQPVRPRTTLLREGFDRGQQYFINEEEVPQAGTRLSVSYNRTRWRDGRVAVWLTTHRGEGRGEGSSGLAFDLLINTPTAPD